MNENKIKDGCCIFSAKVITEVLTSQIGFCY